MPQSEDLEFEDDFQPPEEAPQEHAIVPRPFAPPPAVGRTLPHSLEAEEYLLSSCMLDGAEVVPRCEAAGLGPWSFYDPKHATVYGCILNLFRRDEQTDVALVAEELKANKQLEQVGGFGFLAQVSSRIPTTAQAGYFIGKVRELATLREIIRTATMAVEDCYGFTGDIAELVTSIRANFDRALDPAASRSDWALVPADRLCSSALKPPPELIKGLLYQGGTMMLSGPSKAHKTYTMLAAGIAIASGCKWLDFETVKTPVLYLNLELQDFAAKSRIEHICEAMRIAPPSGLHVANLRGEMVSLDRLSAKVGIAIKQTKAGLVVVDPHYKISSASGVEENSNDAQAAFLYAIETLCIKNGAAVMLAHHFAKGNASNKNAIDRAAGGGALARWPDVVMTLTEHEEDECMTAEFALRNFAPVKPFVVRWRHPTWSRDGSLEPLKLKQPGGRSDAHPADKALEALGDQMLTRKEWLAKTGWHRDTFARKVAKLVEAGKVKLVGGVYSRRTDGDQTPNEPEDVGALAGFNPQDYTLALSAKIKGREKRADAHVVRRIMSGVFGDNLPTTKLRPMIAKLIEVGILNQDKEDGRYYVP